MSYRLIERPQIKIPPKTEKLTLDDRQYTYDDNGNILTVSSPNPLIGSIADYTYSQNNQLVREDNKKANRTYVYTYDNSGNILSKKTYNYTTAATISTTLLDTVNYTYGSAQWQDKLTGIDNTAISYDAIGNPLNWRGTISSINWDGRRLESLNTICPYGDPVTIYFGYNESGVRTSKNFANSMTPSDSYNIE